MSDKDLTQPPAGEFIMFASGDGRVRVECRFESDTIWLSQAAMAELYDKDVRTINEHLINIFSEGELVQNSTIRKFRIVGQERRHQIYSERSLQSPSNTRSYAPLAAPSFAFFGHTAIKLIYNGSNALILSLIQYLN